DTATAWDVFDNINEIYSKCKIEYPFSQIVWDLSKISSELDSVTDIYGQYMGNICYGQVSNPEEYVAEFRAKLKDAGIDKVISEFQRQLDAFYSNQK
ncbi:MAG: DUF3502 domain-containing protein, partial [Treponema sp.]|nr:DUF3502 domain-containing protein [Treponema sp.]